MTTPEAVDDLILVVDDDPATRELMASALRRAGMAVAQASSGEQALAVLATMSADLVITDLSMPGMGGLEFVRTLRSEPSTATLPVIVITGSGDDQGVVVALEAGANDFLAKPVRIEELRARVRAHLRAREAWVGLLRDELRARSEVIASMSELTPTNDPMEAAIQVVTRLSERTDAVFVAVARVAPDGTMQELATYAARTGVRRGGDRHSAELAGYLLGRAREGPWVDEVAGGMVDSSASLRTAGPDLVASAPLYVQRIIVGLLTIGARRDRAAPHDQRRRLLSAAIDYATVMELLAGPAFADEHQQAADRDRLQGILERREHRIVFQPIKDLATRTTVGFEALTRFDDEVRPDVRFTEAASAGLGTAYEMASIRGAVEMAPLLPPDAFLSINVSAQTILEAGSTLRSLVWSSVRPIVLEITEHVRVDDYGDLRAAIRALGDGVRLAVDDAGAGFASLRHLLELDPHFAKLDISLVRGIDSDPLRQSMVAGLAFYAARSRCRLIAEGIETEAEAVTLQGIGIELGQGFLLARPGPIAPES